MKKKLKAIVQFILNPRFLLCFGLAWMITNGWSYVMMGFGVWFGIEWMMAVAGAYLAFLWVPLSPEKIVTCLIAMFLLKWIFPNDQKTLGVLKRLYEKYKLKKKNKKESEDYGAHC